MVEVLFVTAVGVLVVFVVLFVAGRRYEKDESVFSPVEIEWLKEEAEGRISALSSRVMKLSEKERDLTWILDHAEVDGESWAGAEELLVDLVRPVGDNSRGLRVAAPARSLQGPWTGGFQRGSLA